MKNLINLLLVSLFLTISFNVQASYIYDQSLFDEEKVISELFKEFDRDRSNDLDKYEIRAIYDAFYEQIKIKLPPSRSDREEDFFLDFVFVFWNNHYSNEPMTNHQRAKAYAFKKCFSYSFCYQQNLTGNLPDQYNFKYFIYFIDGKI